MRFKPHEFLCLFECKNGNPNGDPDTVTARALTRRHARPVSDENWAPGAELYNGEV